MWLHYMGGDYAQAKVELDLLLQDDKQWRRGYHFIRRALTHRYLGQGAALPAEAPRLAQLTDEWPRPLIDWLLDKTDTEAVLRAARAGTTPEERLCEAYFYMGEKYRADGDSQRAADYYEKALEQGITEYVEDVMARRRLASLRSK
jgi:lipoprotein NlpI